MKILAQKLKEEIDFVKVCPYGGSAQNWGPKFKIGLLEALSYDEMNIF